MIKSMTGFGTAKKLIKNKNIVIEIRSLNSKSLDINLKVDTSLSFIEEYLRKSITDNIIKGKIDVTLNFNDSNQEPLIPFNKTKIKAYLKDLKKDFKIDESHIISNLLTDNRYYNSIIKFKKSDEKKIKSLIDNAIVKLGKYRSIEGKAIGDDLSKCVSKLNKYILKIESLESTRVSAKKKKFRSYFKELEIDFDKSRLEQEIIYYIEKFDINEEIIRLKHHLKFFSSEMRIKGPKGKKLSFIAQELGREINTIGSKANNFNIQSLVVNMKDELEKIKENTFNIL